VFTISKGSITSNQHNYHKRQNWYRGVLREEK